MIWTAETKKQNASSRVSRLEARFKTKQTLPLATLHLFPPEYKHVGLVLTNTAQVVFLVNDRPLNMA